MRTVVRNVVVVCGAALVNTGCYTYSTIDPAGATPGMEVRARVTAPLAAQLASTLAMGESRVVEGQVVDTQSGLTLKVASVLPGAIGAPEGLFQQVQITRSDLLELESKQLDRGKTRLAVGVSAAAAIAIGVALVRAGRSSGDNAVVEPPANFNIGFLRIQLGGPPRRVVPRTARP
jgi:hypothetical protein